MAQDTKEHPSFDDAQKQQDVCELGEIAFTGQALTAEEDRRILRRIDIK